MRVAVCLSGQPRTWRKAGRFWEHLFKGATYDVFFHLWDFNTQSASHFTIPNKETISKVEQEEIVRLYSPKDHRFEGSDVDPSQMLYDRTQRRIHPFSHEDEGDPLLYRHCSQFYSMEYVAMLKREYEIENNFEYDVCIKARPDLLFSADDRLPLPLRNTAHIIHSRFEPNHNEFRMGDIFFYSNSITFDKIAMFYRGLSLMKEDMYGQHVCPEIALMLFTKSLNIAVAPMHHISPKIIRPDGFTGELAEYETI